MSIATMTIAARSQRSTARLTENPTARLYYPDKSGHTQFRAVDSVILAVQGEMLATLFAIVLLAQGRPDRARIDVSVDWAAVPDTVVTECGLVGLENIVLQHLLDAGYAAVRTVSSSGVATTIAADAEDFVVRAVRGTRAKERRVARPTPCDTTIQLALAHALVQVLDEMEEPPPASPRTIARQPILPEMDAPKVDAPGTETETENQRWTLHAGAGVRIPGSHTILGEMSAGASREVAWSVSVGGTVEAAFANYGGATIIEPAFGIRGQFTRAPTALVALAGGLEIALVGHIFMGEGGRGARPDARVAFPLTIHYSSVGLEVAPYFRATTIRHVVGMETTFDSHHVGVLIRLDARFPWRS